jgi:hypothetical protein
MAEIDVTSFWACLMAGAPPLESFWAYLQTLLQVVGGVLRLNPQVFAAMRGADAITGLSLGVVLVAGLMRMLGQSIVLFANRVRPAGFVVRVLASTLEFILNVLAMGVIVWLVMRVLRPDAGLALGEVLRTIPLAYAPYWLGALVLMPYLGIWIERGLKVYVFLALVVAFRGALPERSGRRPDRLVQRPVPRFAAQLAAHPGHRARLAHPGQRPGSSRRHLPGGVPDLRLSQRARSGGSGGGKRHPVCGRPACLAGCSPRSSP